MTNDLKITLARKDIDLKRILRLQALNLPTAVDPQVQVEQGFVSAHHDLATLKAMNSSAAAVIAKDGTKLAGYALAMTRAYRESVPILSDVFDYQDGLIYMGKTLAEHDYIVMGQVCVAEAYRGQRLVDRMYRYFRACYSLHYRFLVTAIAPRNTRSMRVHERCGFERIGLFKGEDGKEWDIVVWNWRE